MLARFSATRWHNLDSAHVSGLFCSVNARSIVDIKIGILHSPRELLIDSSQGVDEVRKTVANALKDDDSVLELTDRRGRQFLVPAAKVAYVEIAESDARRVGFTAGS